MGYNGEFEIFENIVKIKKLKMSKIRNEHVGPVGGKFTISLKLSAAIVGGVTF